MIQGSQEWIDSRVGKVTGSRVGACFTKPRNGSSVSKVREAYLADLLAERLTGKPTPRDGYVDEAAIEWGKKTEPFAVAAYAAAYPCHTITRQGFIDHPTVPMSGASPDGLVDLDGGIEIKCPSTKTHLETVRLGKVPTQHLPQIRWNMACTRRPWWDFVSFDPRAEENQYFCRRVMVTSIEIIAMELGVFAFVMELEARLAEFQAREEA